MSNLTHEQMQKLRAKLRQQAAAALKEIRAKSGERGDEPYVELAGEVADEGDEAAADLIVDIDNALIGMELDELRDITAARERMKHRQYGVCADCGEPIAYERLCAYPTAKRCTRCQGLRERTYVASPHTSL